MGRLVGSEQLRPVVLCDALSYGTLYDLLTELSRSLVRPDGRWQDTAAVWEIPVDSARWLPMRLCLSRLVPAQTG